MENFKLFSAQMWSIILINLTFTWKFAQTALRQAAFGDFFLILSPSFYRLDGNMVVKVADFGLARDIYANSYYRQDKTKLLPIKWMALESLHDRVFSIYTDVVSAWTKDRF